MLWILEAELVGHLIDGQLFVHHILLREVDDLVLDVSLRRHARFFLDEVTEVAGREEHLLCEISDGGQPLTLGLATAEVRLQNPPRTFINLPTREISSPQKKG